LIDFNGTVGSSEMTIDLEERQHAWWKTNTFVLITARGAYTLTRKSVHSSADDHYILALLIP
jgi:hypothetical protein